MKYSTEWKDLHTPPLLDICQHLQEGLTTNFQHVSVQQVDCPDLSERPWSLAAPGICGSPVLLDVGAVPYLIPTPHKDKIYKFEELATEIGNKNALIIGAGHCGFQLFGGNGEMMANLKLGEKENLQTRVAKVDANGKPNLDVYPVKDFGLLGNFLACDGGQSGKVIKVVVKQRTGSSDFISAIRSILSEKYPDQMVGLGGVFQMKSGKANLHIMPPCNPKPLHTDEDINQWLTFHEMSAPLICLSVFYNRDDDMDLRISHTHCYSEHGDGGHYHYDTTPDIVEYEGYFVVAEKLLRVDRPLVTHNIGRD